ncbi:MAG TPA: sigma-70 family RNA polymerase sigma factor [Pyrinomonadaceae bacterium]|nr:sigma-70 family RNA polymerase sigma factor [Pyrinomonadaceae bacterium]
MTVAAAVAKESKCDEIFVERYSRLLKWAFQLTKPDSELAKDVVHDAFIQFTCATNQINIDNVDSYLFGIVRKTYLSHRRRNSRQQQTQLTDLEIDSATTLQLSVDPCRQIQIADELRAICQHACARKDTSITGSILILRFFHGYVPNEVAKLINSSRNIVDVQLRFARAEAIAYLGNPKSASGKNRGARSETKSVETGHDLLTELRNKIFATRRGQCFNSRQLSKFYNQGKALPRATLSHLVSCPECLDETNRLLNLPLLRERNVMDVLGRTSETLPGPIYTLVTLSLGFVSVSLSALSSFPLIELS